MFLISRQRKIIFIGNEHNLHKMTLSIREIILNKKVKHFQNLKMLYFFIFCKFL